MVRGRSRDAGGGVCGAPAPGARVAEAAEPPPLPSCPEAGDDAAADAARERRLLERVCARCHAVISEVCAYSSVPAAFLGALVANESGGDPQAMRFEPAVYRPLKAVAEGRRAAYAGLSRRDFDAEIAEMLHPKAGSFHAVFLTPPFRAVHGRELAASRDEALRELATSWGFTQIMGYHLVGRSGTVRDLLEPRFHFRLALELLALFAERYQLDLAREFAEMFRCWNTGQPYGQTFAPDYVAQGLRRMEIYRSLESAGIGPAGHGKIDSLSH
jgi:hypothetical protein